MGHPARVRLPLLWAHAVRFCEVKLLREPLAHFLVLGALVFAAHAVLDTRKAEEDSDPLPVIRITVSDTDWLRQMWARQWRRAPTDEELTGLLADHLKEEVLAREARKLQLDVGDTVVRRRLAQKMAFLLEDTVPTSEPSEPELRALYDARPDVAAMPGRVSFSHVFFSGQKGSDAATQVGFAARSGAPESPAVGDRFLLGETFADQDEQSLINLFGQTFAQAVLSAEQGRWSGPFRSNYGMHLVNITAVQPSRRRPFDEVRDRLAQEWHRERQEKAKQQLYSGLMQKYRIVADPAVSPLLRSPGSKETHR